jgi:GntR family transcriptional regulator
MILLDYKDSRPIYEQVAEKLLELMILGVLEEDSQMPSVRSLATELSINPNTIQRAYGELERRGFLYTVKGRGSFVGSVDKAREVRREELAGKLGALAQEGRTLGLSRGDFLRLAEQEYRKLEGEESGGEDISKDDEGRKTT